MSRSASARRALFVAAPFLLVALFAPWIAGQERALVPWDPLEVRLGERLSPPSSRHLLGTDELGRDVLSRTIHGTRLSVAAGLLAAAAALLLGTAAGAAAGLGGRKTDASVLFFLDVVQALPPLVLVAAGAAFAPPSFLTAAGLIALTGWPEPARVVRAGARRASTAPFVDAARASGASPARLLLRHVLPHALPPALASAPYAVGAAAMAEAALSFLGLGTPPPAPSWGRALADARASLPEAWWCAAAPAVALLLLVVACRRIGGALAGERAAIESRPSA